MPRDAGPRVTLREVESGHDRALLNTLGGEAVPAPGTDRVWLVLVDGAVTGWIAAHRVGERAMLTFDDGVDDGAIGRQAIGRLIGAPPFDGVHTLAATTDADDATRRALLDATGFDRVEIGEREVWERTTGTRPRTGPQRFLDRDGRIARFPVKAGDLYELLVALAPRVLSPGEVLSEHEINDRIRPLTDDTALLRRHLVDHDLVRRTPSGTAYTLAGGVDNS